MRTRSYLILATLGTALCIAGTLTGSRAPGQALPTLPANSVYGRLGISAGPPQAVPFGQLLGLLFNGSPPFTAHSVLIGEGAAPVAGAVTGTAGQLLVDQGSGNDPSFQPVSGDATLSASGVLSARALLGTALSVKSSSCGAKGDGSTNDTTAIQNCINALVAAGGGTLVFPAAPSCYITSSQLLIDVSAISSNFSGRIHLQGEGSHNTCIKNVSTSTAVLKFNGNASDPQAGLSIQGLRMLGGNVTGSIGFQTNVAAYVRLDDFYVDSFDIGWDATDTEQAGVLNSFFRFNTRGIRANTVSATTDPNGWTFINTVIANNSLWGMQITTGFNLAMYGGSIQFNGSIACGGTIANCWGLSVQNFSGDGIGAGINIQSVDMEGNGGTADIIINQTSVAGWTCNIQGNTFNRNTAFALLGYGTNNILLSGSQAGNCKIASNVFTSSNGYTPSAGRPVISLTNTAALVADDGTNRFTNAVEAPASIYPSGQVVGANIFPLNAGNVVIKATGVNFNSANSDNAITVTLPTGVSNYLVSAVRIGNASASISSATFGIFSATGGGGTAIMAGGQAITVTSASANTNNNAMVVTPATANTQSYNFATLYFRVGTAEGSAATADVILLLVPLY